MIGKLRKKIKLPKKRIQIPKTVYYKPLPAPVVPQGEGWSAVREKILKRDNHSCRICGAEDGESKIHVHHVDRNRDNLKHTNLVTLCEPCHRRVHLEDYWPSDHPYLTPPWGNLF